MKKLLLILGLLLPTLVLAGEGGDFPAAPINMSDQASLQRGAKIFVNYCLSCHSAASMRYNRLKDIGLTDDQIKNNLMLAGEKIGDTMTVAMDKKEAKDWFGATPPDLSVIARARGADWLYAYMRGFYRDDTRPTGWNNTVFDKVGMPNVLAELQGEQRLVTEKDEAGAVAQHLVLEKPGKLTAAEYDGAAADLVNYLVYMGEPARAVRTHMGMYVLIFLAFLFVLALLLKKEFWKDIH
ncbi:MAG TPA: cytochrome c1 [Methylophilaceae bacterium]|jgi:ubiquinol-cytochrome c reductase cytochrome c1 subunit